MGNVLKEKGLHLCLGTQKSKMGGDPRGCGGGAHEPRDSVAGDEERVGTGEE